MEGNVGVDSRLVRSGDLFVALPGAQSDGHRFLPQARAAGCPAALVTAVPESGEHPDTLIVVADALAALHALARHHHKRLNAQVVGITGSVGKTTAKDFLAVLLGGTAQQVHAAPASYNSEIGLPLAVLGAPLTTQRLVLEYGINAPGEMDELLDILKPDFAWLTALGEAHFEGLENLETVCREKLRLVESVADPAHAWVQQGAQQVIEQELSSTIDGQTMEAQGVSIASSDDRWVAVFPQGQRYLLPVVAKHEAELVGTALAIASHLGVEAPALTSRLGHLSRPPGRMETLSVHGRAVIHDAYNANPMSMLAAFKVLKGWPTTGPRVAVLGTMHELGSDSDSIHQRVGKEWSAFEFDSMIAVGAGGQEILKGALAQGFSGATEWFESSAQVADALAPLPASSVILLKASRTEALERCLGPLRTLWQEQEQGQEQEGEA